MLTRRMTDAPTFTRLRDEMDRLFERIFGDYEPYRAWDAFTLRRLPTVNVWQDDDHVFVEAELPGLSEKDIELTVRGNELSIKGERTPPALKEGAVLHRRERGMGAFSRVVHLPVDVDDDDVDATFHNGVLTITLAKAEVAKARRVRVKGTSASA